MSAWLKLFIVRDGFSNVPPENLFLNDRSTVSLLPLVSFIHVIVFAGGLPVMLQLIVLLVPCMTLPLVGEIDTDNGSVKYGILYYNLM